jgi:chorismate mutase/prephenate dehydratase
MPAAGHRHQPGVVEGNKISLMFTAKDGPGSLRGVLDTFDKNGINLTRIESRPSKR